MQTDILHVLSDYYSYCNVCEFLSVILKDIAMLLFYLTFCLKNKANIAKIGLSSMFNEP